MARRRDEDPNPVAPWEKAKVARLRLLRSLVVGDKDDAAVNAIRHELHGDQRIYTSYRGYRFMVNEGADALDDFDAAFDELTGT
jgi:hypothetical protein